MRRFGIAGAIILSAGAAPVFGQQIDQMAPENAVIVLNVRNIEAISTRLKDTGLWDLWKSDQIQSLIEEPMREMHEGVAQMLGDLGFDEGALTWPTSSFGLTVFPVTDEESGLTTPGVLVYADWGEDSGKTHEVMMSILEKGEEDGGVKVFEDEYAGRVLHTIEIIEGEDEFEQDLGNFMPLPDPMELLQESSKTMYYVNDASHFVFSNTKLGIERSLAVIDGEEERSLVDRDEFKATMDQLGESQIYGMVFMKGLMETFVPPEDRLQLGMFLPSVVKLTGRIESFGFNMNMGSGDAMIESRASLLSRGDRSGLIGLIDTNHPLGDPPAYVSPDALSFSQFHFEFGGLLDVIRQVVQSSPMLQMQVPPAQLQEVEAILTPYLTGLEDQVNMYEVVDRPLRADSMGGVLALKARDEAELKDVLNTQLANAPLFTMREFLGHQIYDMNTGGGMMPFAMDAMSIGTGGGSVYIGPAKSVEHALRSVGQRDQATLASTDLFKRATASLPFDSAVAWGFSDTVESFTAKWKVEQLAIEQAMAEFADVDPALAGDMGTDMPEALENLDPELLRQHIGASVWQLRADDNGLVLHSLLLPGHGDN